MSWGFRQSTNLYSWIKACFLFSSLVYSKLAYSNGVLGIMRNKIYLEDCIVGMKKLADDSVDIVIADPPYNLSKGGNWSWDNSAKLEGFGGNWSKVMQSWDSMPLSDYFLFTLNWLEEVKRVVKPSGSIWIHGTYHNIGIINFALQILEIEMINEVVWYKRNSFPNLSGRRLTASHETVLWAHTGGEKNRKYHFNYEESKNHIFEGDLLKQPGKQMRTVWDIPNNKKKEELLYGKHPTQKPERLIERILRLSSKPGDLVLSPFCGSGTECVVAKKMGLDYLSFELEQEYVEITNNRLKNTEKGIIEWQNPFLENIKQEEASLERVNIDLDTDFESNALQDKFIVSNHVMFHETLNFFEKKYFEEFRSSRFDLEKEVFTTKTELVDTTEQVSFDELLVDDDSKPLKKKVEVIPPILKWTGSKRKQANEIFSLFPKEFNRYFEPFLGGGALLYLVSKNQDKPVIGNDIYTPLIEFWTLVKENPQQLVNYYKNEWTFLQNDFPAYFYDVRDRFNANPNGMDLSFLTRTCVNGIVRFNKNGDFNNSIHLSRRGMTPEKFESIVYSWTKRLENVAFKNEDYREVLSGCKSGDLVYFDPPYASSNNRYIQNLDLEAFFKELELLNLKGVKWLLSFDGSRGDLELEYPVPQNLYKNKYEMANGNSTLRQVLGKSQEKVTEMLYTNF